MKKGIMKKTYSLTMTEVLKMANGLLSVVLGVVKLMNPTTPIGVGITKVLLGMVLVLVLVCWGFRLKGKFDIWDEGAKEHYDTAKKNVFDFASGLIGGAAVAWILIHLVGIEFSIALNAWHLLIVYGLVELGLSVNFIILEKREV